MARWLIDRAGVQITVKTSSERAKQLIELALSAMRVERVKKTQGIKITVKRRDGQWILNDVESGLKRKLTLPGDLIYHLTDRIVFHIADKSKGVHCLHAAAVSVGDKSLIIPADSGAGKSSFTTWLAANGFAYLSDELILIDENQKIRGLGRPIQIKPHGIDAIAELVQDPSQIQEGKFANAVPLSAIGGQMVDQGTVGIGAFVFPRYKADSGFSFKKLSSAEAGMSLMGNHVNARNLEGHGFRDMMSIIRNTPCYSLEYGGFATLPSDFSDQLKALLGV